MSRPRIYTPEEAAERKRAAAREGMRRLRARRKASKATQAAPAPPAPTPSPRAPSRAAAAPPAPPAAPRPPTPSNGSTRKRQDPLPLPGPLPGRIDYSDLPEWAGSNLLVPSGRLEGQPFVFPEWQTRFSREGFEVGVIESGFSLARKQGKTGFVAALCLFTCLRAVNYSIVVTSEKAHFAGLLRDHIKKLADVSGFGDYIVDKTSPQPGKIVAPNGNGITFLAADKGNPGQAEGANLAIIDECGLLEENQRELYNSMQSSTSTTDGIFLSIGTQKQGPMFKEQRSRASLEGRVFHHYTTPMDYDLDDPDGWAMSNPSLGGIKSFDYMTKQIERAKESPEDELFIRSDDLNQPLQIKQNMLLTPSKWERVTAAQPQERAGPCVLTFDFGASDSMTAATALWPATGRVEAWGCFPHVPDLDVRGRQDKEGNLYVEMHRRGQLWLLGNELSDIPEFIKRVLKDLDGEEIVCLGADFYKKKDFKQALVDANINHLPLVFRGGFTGAREGAFDIRAFQRRATNGPLAIGRGAGLLTLGVLNTVLEYDKKGNPSLAKVGTRRRIDPASALVIACGIAEGVEVAAERPSIIVA